jgi:chaperonin GroEL
MLKQASIKTANNAGDGTTTSTLLAQQIIQGGLNYLDKGSNAVEIKKGIDSAVKEVVAEAKKAKAPKPKPETAPKQKATKKTK